MFWKLFKSTDKHGNPTSTLRIFLIILLAIVIDQSMIGILLEEIAPIDPTGRISSGFLILSIPFALFLASLSDFHCRRKILIFALVSLTISSICNLFFSVYNNVWFIYLALFCKGIGGNVTPIALASLATIMPHKKFTASLAIAICGYSLGSWVPIYLRPFAHLSLFMPFFSLTCCIIAINWFRETSFDSFKFLNNNLNFRRFYVFALKEWKQVAVFSLLPPVILTLIGFIFSEISFYQILLRGEVLLKDHFYSDLALRMGLTYYIGTFALCILKFRKFTDIQCLTLGMVLALTSLSLSLLINKYYFFYNLSIPLFSFSFALLTPSLFSILSKIKKLDEQGKIYGLLDLTDTTSVLIATGYIKYFKNISFTAVLGVSLTILIVSSTLIWIFIYYIKKLKTKQ